MTTRSQGYDTHQVRYSISDKAKHERDSEIPMHFVVPGATGFAYHGSCEKTANVGMVGPVLFLVGG